MNKVLNCILNLVLILLEDKELELEDIVLISIDLVDSYGKKVTIGSEVK